VESAIKMIGELLLTDQQKRLVELAGKRSAPAGQRKAALESLMKLDPRRHAAVLGSVLADAEAPLSLREHSANQLAQANQSQTRDELLKILPTAPANLQTTIAVGLAASPAGAEKLLDAAIDRFNLLYGDHAARYTALIRNNAYRNARIAQTLRRCLRADDVVARVDTRFGEVGAQARDETVMDIAAHVSR